MHDIRTLDSESLFAASDWMRLLARHLIHDDDRADDLVQEAWQAALRKPPRAALRPWLGGILRRKAKEARRAQANRRAREERAAVSERQPSTVELAACAEEQRYLIDCVLALPEKYREVLLLRFYEDLPPRSVSERLGLPVNTVLTQTQRALERLREKLDERHSGDRRAWGLALLPLASGALAPETSGSPSPPNSGSSALSHSATGMWTAAGMVVVLTIGFLASGSGGSGNRNLQAASGINEESDAAARSADETATTSSSSAAERRSVPGQSHGYGPSAFARTIHGEIQDAVSRKPVAAFLDGPNETRVVSSDTSGKFSLSLAAEGPCEIRISHPKYETKVLSLSADEIGELHFEPVKLAPKLLTRITALDAFGSPLPQIACSLLPCADTALEGRGQDLESKRAPLAQGATGPDGVLEIPLAEPYVILGTDPSGRMSAVRATPSSSGILRFDGPKRTLHVVDGAGRPVAGRDFPIGWTASAARAAYYVTTGEDGTTVLPSGAGHLEIAMSAPRTMLRSLEAGDKTLFERGEGRLSLRAAVLAGDAELTLHVEVREHVLNLVDDETGEAITGKLWYQLQSYQERLSRWSSLAATEFTQVAGGQAKVDGWFVEPDLGESSDRARRWLAVEGYEVLLVPTSRDLRSATLRLQAAPNRELFVADQVGRPLHTMVMLRFGANASVRVLSDESGYVGRFPWAPGEPWTIYSTVLGHGTEKHIIEASELEAHETVWAALPVPCGSLRILDVPQDGPPLYAGNANVFPRLAVYSGGDALFHDLPAGEYAVGSKEFMMHAVRRGSSHDHQTHGGGPSPLHVLVAAGEERTILWNPDWIAGEALRGRVHRGDHTGANLAVLPIYGAWNSTVHFGADTPWRYTSEDGTFSTDPMAPRPSAFLFARMEFDSFDYEPIVLDVQPVRDDGLYALELTSFELRCSPPAVHQSPRTARVWLVGTPQGLAAPMQVRSGLWPLVWDMKQPLMVEDLPTNIELLRIRVDGAKEAVEVAIAPGAHSRVQVRLPQKEERPPEKSPAPRLQGD